MCFRPVSRRLTPALLVGGEGEAEEEDRRGGEGGEDEEDEEERVEGDGMALDRNGGARVRRRRAVGKENPIGGSTAAMGRAVEESREEDRGEAKERCDEGG